MNIDRRMMETVRQSVTAIDAAQALGLTVDRGNRCHCLWHSDRHPSMKLYEGNRGCWCFVCHNGGSVIDMVMQAHHSTLPEAVSWLNDAFHLGMHVERPFNKAEAERAERAASERREEKERLDSERKMALDLLFEAEKLLGDVEETIRTKAPRNDDESYSDEFLKALKTREEMSAIANDARDRYEALTKQMYGK